jgi:hypothetical protein
MKHGYARTSTDEQTTALQTDRKGQGAAVCGRPVERGTGHRTTSTYYVVLLFARLDVLVALHEPNGLGLI